MDFPEEDDYAPEVTATDLLAIVSDWADAKRTYDEKRENTDVQGLDAAYFLENERLAVERAEERFGEALNALIDQRVKQALSSLAGGQSDGAGETYQAQE